MLTFTLSRVNYHWFSPENGLHVFLDNLDPNETRWNMNALCPSKNATSNIWYINKSNTVHLENQIFCTSHIEKGIIGQCCSVNLNTGILFLKKHILNYVFGHELIRIYQLLTKYISYLVFCNNITLNTS